MVFCGQCGLLIPPGSTKCPRCGTPVDENPVGQQAPTANDINNETQVSMHAIPQHKPGQPGDAYSARTQQEQGGYQTYSNNAPTSIVPSSTRPTPAYPAPPPHTSNPYNPVAPSPYPYGQEGYAPQQHTPYYQPQPTTSQPRRRNGLLLTLVILTVLIVLVTGGVLLANSGKISPPTGNNPTATTVTQATSQPTDTATAQPTDTPEATATPTPQTTPTPTVTAAQAEGIVYRYYNYINAQQYQQAYNTWAHINQTYDDFKNGFATTAKDTIQTISTSDDPQGMKVSLTLQALSTDGQTTMYNGYYIVSQQADGSLKFVDGQMNKAS